MAAIATCLPYVASAAAAQDALLIPAGEFRSVLPVAPGQDQVRIRSFKLDRTPTTNEQFARFLQTHPQWQRDRIARLFADERYLVHWHSAREPGSKIERQPVTQVSWFAATAYCQAHGGRLPTWHEWEFVAAADEQRRDARDDPQWRQRILTWYASPNGAVLPAVGRSESNIYGIQDLHGLVWEWVEDFNGMMVSADNRAAGDPDITKFCGSGALSLEQKDNYAVLMRVAMLSSLQARYTTVNSGFRCAFDLPERER